MHVSGTAPARDESTRGVRERGKRGGTAGGLGLGEGGCFMGAVVTCSAAARVDVGCLRDGGVGFCDVEGHSCCVGYDAICTGTKFKRR